jgi:hypothetical protein
MVESSPNWQAGYIPTPFEWNNWWSLKLDATNAVVNGGPYLKTSGGNVTGRLSITGATGGIAQVISANTIVGLDASSGIYSNSAIRLNTKQPINFTLTSARLLYFDNAGPGPAGLQYSTAALPSPVPVITLGDTGDIYGRDLNTTRRVVFNPLPVNAANDAAAASAGVPVGATYRNGSILMVRAV